jgi:hypothetical protein
VLLVVHRWCLGIVASTGTVLPLLERLLELLPRIPALTSPPLDLIAQVLPELVVLEP